MKWILIIAFLRYNHAAVDHIEFPTKEGCTAAVAEILKIHESTNVYAICVEDK